MKPTVLRFRTSRFSRRTEKSVAGAPAASPAPVRMASAPTPKSPSLPVTRPPPRMGTAWPPAIPIWRLKKSTGVLLGGPKLRVDPEGGARDAVPKLKIPCPSRKNSRFSGKKRLKRVRLICWASASTWAKSVFQVRSAVSPLVIPTLASTPKSLP